MLNLVIAGVCAGMVSPLLAETAETLGEVTVTGTREAQSLAETPASIGVIDEATLSATNPTHPSQIMGQIPGVWVNVTGGEGHQTAIRQPLTTSPVYLYLEDGIPTRSTGFFNHNALYEINMPQAGGIEVTRGPGTALYGSDAIGGVVNVLTREPSLEPELMLGADVGEFGFKRLLISGSNSYDADGYRGDINLTTTDGWRDATEYDRQSTTLRWDHAAGGDMMIKTVFSWSNIDQQTAGSSVLSESDYLNNPTLNYTPISFREVKALRLSSAIEKENGNSLISFTPYVRVNDMDILPNWSLSYDPTVYNTQNDSLGLLAKYRQDFPELNARVIVGADLDYSPGSRYEQSITTTPVNGFYTSYTVGTTIYDYDVTFQGISPYVHGEISPLEKLRVTAGLRYDNLSYDYDNQLTELTSGRYRRPADTTVDYTHVSPKLGMTYEFMPELSGFAAYNHAFRAPSESQLFRQGSALNTVDLEAVKVDSYEMGVRGNLESGMRYELAVYSMTKEDDILNYRDPVSGATEAVNAGETLHKGVELGVGAGLTDELQLDIAASYSKHTYEEWIISGTANYSGNEMETAPRQMANTRLTYTPAALEGGRMSVEWVKLGSYWMDADNTQKYDGHDLYNARFMYPVKSNLELSASVMNISDERYAESSSYTTSRGRQFAPGMQRTYYASVRYYWY
jgi:outer membrane receptor protein involved in Fe transport